MKTTLKLTALLLCLLMLVPCIASCAGGGETDTTVADDETTTVADDTTVAGNDTTAPDDGDDTTVPDDGDDTTAPDDGDGTTAPIYDDTTTPDETTTQDQGDLAETNLGGYAYKAYVRSSESGNGAFACEDFWVAEYSSDPLSYAVYQRNYDIEQAYNCRIRQVDSTTETMYDEMRNFYLNGDQYELAILLAHGAGTCATSNLLKDVYTLENIKLEHATYDQNSVEQFTMGDKLYYFSGDMNISPLDSAAVTIFNPDLHKTYDFGEVLGHPEYNDLYAMVASGDWTVGAMLEMAGVVNQDADNDGGVYDATIGDQVGYFQYSASSAYYWYGCGARISELDLDGGYPSIVYGTEKNGEIFNFLYENLNTTLHPEMPVGGSDVRYSNYATQRTLFTDILLWDIRTVLHVKADAAYGILPIPKYNAAQTRYFDVVYYPYQTTHLWSVPNCIKDADKASFLLHVIAVYSAMPDGTMDAYYTKTLELSVAQDAGSRATLKIVRDSVTYDICLLYDWGDFYSGPLAHIHSAASNPYGEATNQDALDVAEEEMNQTLEGFKNPQLPSQDQEAA